MEQFVYTIGSEEDGTTSERTYLTRRDTITKFAG